MHRAVQHNAADVYHAFYDAKAVENDPKGTTSEILNLSLQKSEFQFTELPRQDCVMVSPPGTSGIVCA